MPHPKEGDSSSAVRPEESSGDERSPLARSDVLDAVVNEPDVVMDDAGRGHQEGQGGARARAGGRRGRGQEQQQQQQRHRDFPAAATAAPSDVDVIFKRVPTVFWASLAVAWNVVMILLVFLLPIICSRHRDTPDEDPVVAGNGDDGAASAAATAGTDVCKVSSFSILVYAHCVHWLTHLIVDQRLKWHHKKNRLRGYVEFYIQTKNIRRAPFYLVSFGNAVLLVTTIALDDYCDQTHCKDKLFKVDYLRVVITVLCLIILCCWGNYIINIREFNRNKKLPDVLRMESRRRLMLVGEDAEEGEEDQSDRHNSSEDSHAFRSDSIPHHYVTLSLENGRPVEMIRDEIIELQAELLRYLHSHVESLNETIKDLERRNRRSQEYV